MLGTKWLSEAIHSDEIQKGTLNLVCAPTGSGKTHWALRVLPHTVSQPYRMVYLIDTINGKEQLLKSDRTQFYSDEWRETVQNGAVWFGEAVAGNKIVVMTYAKFGFLADRYSQFGFSFELIVCDEIHNLPRFRSFVSKNADDIPVHKIAQERLEQIIHLGKTKVIGLSATPKRAEEKINCPSQYIPVDEDVKRFETKQTIPYTNLHYLLKSLSPTETGLMYITHIEKMKAIWEEATELGFRAIAIWSTRSDKQLSEEQYRARQYILDNEALPPEYDLVIINASSETSINIKGKVDYIVVHTQEEEPQVQVRGRYRGDLEKLYLLDYGAEATVPDEFLGIKLFTEDKARLCETLGLRDGNSYLLKWTSVKQRLLESEYTITEGRSQNRRYAIITF